VASGIIEASKPRYFLMYVTSENIFIFAPIIMAAVATKKPGGDLAVQLTFPLNFQKAFNGGIGYFPSAIGENIDLFVGQDFQSKYHEQKRLDANQSVMNGLQANATAERLMMTGPHNYHVPKPVLGQRRYANPSYGAEALVSTRRDNGPDAPFRVIEGTDIMMGMPPIMGAGSGSMRGGVLKTAQGYDFYKGQLSDRIEQLNRINALAQGFAVPMGQGVNTRNNETEGGPNKVEFFLLLRQFMDAVEAGDYNRFTFDSAKDFVGKLLNLGPVASEEDFQDIIEGLDDIERNLNAEDSGSADGRVIYGETLRVLADKTRDYTRVMFANMERSDKEKKALSKSLVKTLKLDQLLRRKSLIEALGDADSRIADAIEDFDDGDDDGRFEGPSLGREDGEQMGVPRAPFAGEGLDENRDRWGRRGRPQRDGEMPGFFGEEVAADMPGVVAPLDMAGFDPGAQVPPPDAGSMTDALEMTMRNDLRLLATTDEDQEKLRSGEFGELVAKLYPDPSNFVSNVASAMEERGFTKAQVAAAMGETNLPFFADYIARNGGEYGPAPIVPAYRYPPAGPQPGGAPLYGPPPPAAVAPAAVAPAAVAPAIPLPAWLSAYPTRFLLKQKLFSVGRVKAFMESVPADAGLKPYNPRAGTDMKSVWETLIRNIRAVVPSY
jgi:hypothetical protein